MGEIEWDGNARRAVRTEPLARYPRVWPQPDTPLFELFMETVDAILEPGAFDRNPQTAEAALEQLLIRRVSQAYFRRGIGPPNMRAIQHRDGVMGRWWQQPPRVARGQGLDRTIQRPTSPVGQKRLFKGASATFALLPSLPNRCIAGVHGETGEAD
jgi:hypothetical protein